ncbi:DUF6160 family protein [Bermanella sp. R86510]|uniref:DUF6160 family protein n=1 Tax=unclassified Bermanella TaxID=2627862 RepID=UPI0037CC19DB
MRSCISLACVILTLWTSFVFADLEHLGDDALSGVTGQAGLTVEMHKQIKVDEIRYSDKDGVSQGGILDLKDIVIGHPSDVNNQQAVSIHQYDIDGNDGLVIKSTYQPTRIQIGSISVGDHRGSVLDGYASRKSFGSFIYDWTGTNTMSINGKAAGDSGFVIDSHTQLQNVDFRWVTNGNTLLADNMTIDTQINNMTIDIEDNGTEAYLVLAIPNMQYDVSLGGLCFAETANCGAQSLGQIASSLALENSYIHIFGGGRDGTGITMDASFTINESHNNQWSYTDDSTLKIADMSGYANLSGYTFDIGKADSELGDYIALQFDRLEGQFRAQTIEIGAGRALGEFEIIYDFQDATHGGQTYQNTLKLAPGIAWAGQSFADLDAEGFTELASFYNNVGTYDDGISLYNEWNLNADITYTDRENSNVAGALMPGKLMISNFNSYGSGYASLDVRKGNSINSNHAVDGSYLALGLRNFNVHYSIDGLKLGGENAPLQGGTELLLPLGIYPAYEFTMNAAVEIRTGGQSGSGLTFDGDVLMTDGTFAYTTNIVNQGQVDEKVLGIWADDVTYKYHFRDFTLDVGDDPSGAFAGDAIRLRQGELWSDMDIANLRWGEKTTGESLGRIRMQQYQENSELVIQAGGAGVDGAGNVLGASCVGGSGTDLSSCESNGGQWLDRGTDGLTISMKQNWMNALDAQKRNTLTWENNRTIDVDGKSVNNTGTQLILDNIRTSDGYNLTDNEFGMQLSLALDVAPTRVIKKADGADKNGVFGNAGQEQVITGTGVNDYEYKDTNTLTATDKANRPLGFAVKGQLQIKELDIESIQLKHPNAPAPQTIVHQLKMQNLNMTSNLMATPIN